MAAMEVMAMTLWTERMRMPMEKCFILSAQELALEPVAAAAMAAVVAMAAADMAVMALVELQLAAELTA